MKYTLQVSGLNKDLESTVKRINLNWILLNQLKWILDELFTIFIYFYLYLRAGFSSPAQASFFLISTGDGAGDQAKAWKYKWSIVKPYLNILRIQFFPWGCIRELQNSLQRGGKKQSAKMQIQEPVFSIYIYRNLSPILIFICNFQSHWLFRRKFIQWATKICHCFLSVSPYLRSSYDFTKSFF